MPEENEMLDETVQTSEEERLSQAQLRQQKDMRNAANNANVAKTAANVAQASGHPIAAAIGKGINIADKVSGGKATQKLGNAMTKLNKYNGLQGKALQAASNKIAESGTSSRINQALSKKNSVAPVSSKMEGKSNATVQDKHSSFFSKKEVEEQTSDGGGVSFKATVKFLKIGLIAFTPIMVVLVFMNLIVAGSQTYLQVIGLGQADSVSADKADEAIREHGSEGLFNEDTDFDNNEEGAAGDLTGYIYEDTFVEDNISRQKFSKMNFIASTKDREYNEADLTQLEDFYSGISSYENGNYNMNTVYKFFFKLFYIQRHYRDKYWNETGENIYLDMPLIMSVLTTQSTDMNDVFVTNIEDYKIVDGEETNNKYFRYDHNWSNEILSKDSSIHDIEILAQNMVTRIEGSSCSGTIDGACYKLVDEEQYKEFLKQFLERKYFLNGYKLGEVPKDSNYQYTYVNPNNESAVNNMIVQIYDAKEQYEDLAGGYTTVDEIIPVSNNLFWWPIGSKETELINGVLFAKGTPATVFITSNFGDEEGFRTSAHGGLDIGNAGNGPGVLNVIAVKSGEVIYPTNDAQTQYADNGSLNNRDGEGYGNYVKIKHSDGTYTLYAHLAQNSITVRAGDVVEQGQVIGKMGHSGQSTGTHLHFEVRLGADSGNNRVYPLNYVNPDNPRPMSYGSGNSFSLTTTTLSKEEFVARMRDYYDRTKKEGFYKNFVLNAEEIYDASLANNVNPELVVVTAGTEQNWTLNAACQYTNNYWGIGIPNGKGCNSGGKYDSLSEGIAAYAKLLSSYNDYGSFAKSITNRYNERAAAGCDSSGHGLPGTLEGMQSIYSWVGNYRYNPGSSGSGGCYYFDRIYGKSYCLNEVSTCASKVATDNCPVETKTTVCEQNDYTAYLVKEKVQMRYDIFGI